MGVAGKFMRALAYTLATLVILLAVAVGVLRLLLPVVPEYRQDIRRIATEATGFDVDFGRVSASWPLRGPRLQLYDVELRDPGGGDTVLAADEVSLGISLFRFVTERAVVVDYVGVTGAALLVERQAGDDGWILQGRPLSDFLAALPQNQSAGLPALNLWLEDLHVTYRDQASAGPALRGVFQRLRMELDASGVEADGEVDLGGVSSGQLEVALQLDGRLTGPDAAVGTWDLAVTGRDVTLPPLLTLGTRLDLPVLEARGDLVFAGRFRGPQPQSMFAELDLAGVQIGSEAASAERFEQVAGKFEWETRADGWLLAANELRLARNQRLWPRSSITVSYGEDPNSAARRLGASASYLRLDDLYAIVTSLATTRTREQLLPATVSGELRAVSVDVELPADADPGYRFEAEFEALGVDGYPGGLAATGLSGSVAADQDGGRLELDSREVMAAWPRVFLEPVTAEELSGFLIWRVTADGLRVLSDSFQLRSATSQASSRFEFSLPRAGGGLHMDLDASVRSGDAVAVLGYLPLGLFPPQVSDWLLRAVEAGEVPDARIRFRGPLRKFPYSHGEGLFRVDLSVAGGRLDYADGWPPVEDLSGDIVFDGVRLYSHENRGSLSALPLRNVEVEFEDLRRGVLTVEASQTADLEQLLAFLRDSPVAETLGPALDRVRGRGPVASELTLTLPMARLRDFGLLANFDPQGASVGLDGVDFDFSEIEGRVTLDRTQLSASLLRARLLGESVTAQLRPASAQDDSFSHYLTVAGATPLQRWVNVLGIPGGGRLGGVTDWTATAMIPRVGEGGADGLRIQVSSDLVGASIDLPRPLAKSADSSAPLDLNLRFGESGAIRIDGRLRDDLGWALRLTEDDGRWRMERGEVRAGVEPASLPREPGLQLTGRLDVLRLADWVEVGGDQQLSGPGLADVLSLAAWQVDELVVLGQVFRDTELDIRNRDTDWAIEVDGPRLQGQASLPLDFGRSRPWTFELGRAWLGEVDGGDGEPADPRDVPPVRFEVDDFRIRDMQFGRLALELRPEANGVTVNPFRIDGGSFTITGDGAWVVSDNGEQQSQLRASMVSTDVEDSLQRLGYEPVIDSDLAKAEADIRWPGAPDGAFLSRASGELHIEFGPGALLELDAGGGRLLGILSIASLPRRLSLDFRDVFEEGFGFDSLQGDFSLEDGDAFTCNLGLNGSVADMAIVGRTGLGSRDYDQLAVVRPHVSNVLALGGVAVGGPAVGAAVLLVSQIFRKPLSQLGESYYEIKGPWENASVERIARTAVDSSRFSDCERYLEQVLPEPLQPDDLVIEPVVKFPEEAAQ